MYLTNAHVRIYTIPLGLAVLAALVGLTTWNLSRGGSAALGIFTLYGRKTARRRAPRPAAPPHQPAPRQRGETPRHRHRRRTAGRGAGAATAIVLILLAGVIACALIHGSSPAGRRRDREPAREGSRLSRPRVRC